MLKSEAFKAQGYKSPTATQLLLVRAPLKRNNYYLLMFSFHRTGTKAKTRR